MKIFFVASHPQLAIGYSKIASFIGNYIASYEEIEFVHYALETPSDGIAGRYINPDIRIIPVESMGFDEIGEHVTKEKPDVVFFYQDAITTFKYIKALEDVEKTFKAMVYLDLVYEFENYSFVKAIGDYCDHILCFSECWKKNMMDMKVPEEKLHILDHPLDTNKIMEVDKQIARKEWSLDERDFIVLNLNRNSYRKCWDLTFKAFIMFVKRNNMNPRLKLFVGALKVYGAGWDFLELLRTICCELDVDYDTVVLHHIITTPDATRMTDERVNLLYNACDVGINTTCGEGFGLCNMEHGALGRPQIVTDYGGLSDIFEDDYAIKVKPLAVAHTSLLLTAHNGYMAFCSADDFADGLEKFYKNIDFYDRCSEQSRSVLCEKYDPDVVKYQLRQILISCELVDDDSFPRVEQLEIIDEDFTEHTVTV